MASDSSTAPSDQTPGESPETKADAAPSTQEVRNTEPVEAAAPDSPTTEVDGPVVDPAESAAETATAKSSPPLPAAAETGAADTGTTEAATDTAATDTAAADTAAADTGAAEEGERKFKIQVGSRRQDRSGDRPISSRSATAAPLDVPQELVDAVSPDAAASTPIDSAPIPMPTSEPVPVPSIRGPVSAEMQSEIDAAMGNVELDELMTVPQDTGAVDEIEEDQRRKATVIRIEGESVFFDLGGRVEGLVPIRQFKTPPSVGDGMEVVVRSLNADDGFYELSVPGQSIDVAEWSDLTEGAIVDARITGANTGGLECMVGAIRGFIPASQVAMFRVEEFAEYIGLKLPCVCTEVNAKRKNLVVSHRAVLEREREEARKKLLEELKPGQECEGIVRNLRDFGAFVDLGGVDGMIHISQLSWERVKHPSDVLTEGQKIKVKIEKINTETGKIGLSFRDLTEHPWNDIETKCVVGSTMTGSVTRTAKFGAFVRLFPGVEGLIHISELSHQHVRNVDDILKEGQEIEVKIMSVDRESQRIGLSLKATLPEPEPDEPTAEVASEQPARPKRTKPLKGGVGRGSGGESVGLNW
ncbi:MAG: S1 RNA-binding domain-containing protein [Pirellulaceae bacterium]|nr:S1 RNA-binding domain-containing protein [Pirellulaceae bacterium]